MRPPPRNDGTPRGGGVPENTNESSQPHQHKRVQVELQGLTNARPASQPPPAWEKPAGSAAADLLDDLLAAKAQQPRFEIWTLKVDGRRSRFYQSYADRAVAADVASRLRELGLPCEIRLRVERPCA